MADRPSLAGIRAKLDRAREHLELLDAETAAFFNTEPVEVVGEYDPQANHYVFRAKVHREPPPRFGVLVGDFAHNIRSVLDHLVYQLVLLAGTQARWTKAHQFPILTTTPADFARRAIRMLAGIATHHVTLIEQTQPYRTPHADQHALAILNRLINTDKHQLVHATIGVLRVDARQHGIRFTANRHAGTLRTPRYAHNRHLVDGADLVRVPLAPLGTKPEVNMHGQLPIEIAFGDRALRGDALPAIEAYVRRFIDLFAGDFPPDPVG